MQRAVAASEPAAATKQVRLIVSADGGGVPTSIRTDPMRLEQILVNLLSNAIRHSPEQASVDVKAEAAGNGAGVAFSVVDHGPGVPPELRDRIFEPFERFDPQSGHGTGLGLPVSRRLAEALGGTLTVEETGGGGGATFILKLPS